MGTIMKNVFFFLSVFFVSTSVMAQEAIPLFDEIPSFVDEKKEEKPVTEKATATTPKLINVKENGLKSNKPNLGRDATPITSLRLAPFPDFSVNLDASSIPPVQEKKFEEKVIEESEILKRENPLTMTEKAETGDEYLQRLINERKLRKTTGRSSYTNPLGLRHDADGFLISSVGLGMMPDEVVDALEDQGYLLIKTHKVLPPALSVQYEKDCRLTRKLYIPADIRACIDDKADEDETTYIKQMVFNKDLTRETIVVDYTSLATENVAYRIFYKNKGDPSLNSSRKNRILKENRKKEFWNLVFGTYGLPDNNEEILWGNENTSFLTAKMQGSAYDAYLLLESTQLQNEDYEKWAETISEVKAPSSFGFVSKEDVVEE